MAAGTWKWFAPALLSLLKGDLDLDADVRMVLVTEDYTPDQTHDTWAAVMANEVVNGNGYATHGQDATPVPGAGSTDLIKKLDIANITWAGATITAKYAVLVKDANGDNALAGTDLLIGILDLNTAGGSESSTAGNFTVQDSADGALTLAAAAFA
jgi:hypothetical protein